MEKDLQTKIWRLVEEIVEKEGYELVDIRYFQSQGRWILRVYIDSIGGVTLNDCVKITKILDPVLDVEDLIPHSYYLEVSSPGLDRPLKSAKDFKRFVGKIAKIELVKPVEGRRKIKGKIKLVKEESVVIDENNASLDVKFNNIKKANLVSEL